MERCPNCRAGIEGLDQCRRCGLELGSLRAVERAGEAALGRAVQRLLEGDRDGAIRDLEQARSLRDEVLARTLIGFARAEPGPGVTSGSFGNPAQPGLEPETSRVIG